MKIRIFDEKQTVTEEKEVWLKLEPHGVGVMLVACDSNGNRVLQGNILSIDAHGISRIPAFNPDLGFGIESVDGTIRTN